MLTAIRTGAASGAATDLLARPDASTAAVFGAGVQRPDAIGRRVCRAPDPKSLDFRCLSGDRRAVCCRDGTGAGVDIQPAESAAEAVRAADVICTATTSKTPVFHDRDLRPGVHINAVGSYQPVVQELPAETVVRAQLVVDHRPSRAG